MGILFPPSLLFLEFKSKEEMELMPQTAEEHIQRLQDDEDSDSSSSSNGSSHVRRHTTDQASSVSSCWVQNAYAKLGCVCISGAVFGYNTHASMLTEEELRGCLTVKDWA